jgi:putative transposase
MTKAPFAKGATSPNPTDRAKRGVKRSLLTDGSGIPLALVVDGANRHDSTLLIATLDGIVIARPEPTEEHPQHLCLDAAYDGASAREEAQARGYIEHIRSRGQEKVEKVQTPGYRALRWVVERTHSWLNRSRRLLVRWEKKTQNYLAFLQLAGLCSVALRQSLGFRISSKEGA